MSDVITSEINYLDPEGLARFKGKIDDMLLTLDGGEAYMEEYTFLSSGWDSGGQYSLEEDYPSETYDIWGITSSNESTTDEMLEAWNAAGIYGYEEYNVVTAHGDVPSINITMVLLIRKNNEGGGGFGGGHKIVNATGNVMPQRSKMKFVGADVTDDEINDTTVITCKGGTKIVKKPTVTVGEYIYDGTSHGPTIVWEGDMADNCVITHASETDAGNYTLTIALKNKSAMVWNDITTTDLTYSWSIAKANQTITLSSDSVTLDPNNLTATVTVSGAQGTISATTSDNTIATASVSDSTVTINNVNEASGSATITVSVAGTNNYNTATDSTIAVTASFIPNGATITPTDDIQTWLKCAGIHKNYTTLAAVLSDTSTLSALISDSNAVDYMVRSTTWATDTCSNQTAMSYIGLNNYCSNTLLAHNTWSNVICNSSYFESVLNAKVPIMTSNTTPSGKVTCSHQYNDSQFSAWHVFNDTGAWAGNNASTEEWIAYQFTKQIIIQKIYFVTRQADQHLNTKDFWVEISNDGINWTTIYTEQLPDITTAYSSYQYYDYTRNFPNNQKCTYCRFRSTSWAGVYFWLNRIQFYGRQDL